MKTTVFQGIIDAIASDATILGYLGGTYVFRGKADGLAHVPSITVRETTESSLKRVCYNAFPVRDNDVAVQVDVWVSAAGESFPYTGEHIDQIAERVDELLVGATPVSGTRAWQKVGSSQQYEDDTSIWHNALRYTFQYSITDT